MTMPSRLLPTVASPLHAYRHLLREASYLPLVARPFVSNYVKRMFRRHRSIDTPERFLQSAQRGQRFLRAASMGSLGRLRTVLLHVFGRVGRRRRMLISELVRPEPAVDSNALQEQIRSAAASFDTGGGPPRKLDWLDTWDVEKLLAFVKSQSRHPMRNSPCTPIEPRRVDLARYIPKENIWKQPLSARSRRAKLKKLWRDMIPKVLPPIPRGEWELLRDLASGQRPAEEWQLPRRRTRAAPTAARERQEHGDAWRWEAYATSPTSRVEQGRSRRLRPMSGLEDDTSPMPAPPVDHHVYTRRTLARLYREIWTMTATMDKKADGHGWNITWGGTEVRIAEARSLEFFIGAPVTAHARQKQLKSTRQQTAS